MSPPAHVAQTVDVSRFDGHTPGPWEHELSETYNVIGQDKGRVAMLCHLKGKYGLAGRRSSAESAANALLIAAAPELLAAYIALRVENRALLDAKEEAERSLNLVREVAEDYKETCGILSAKTADLETDNARLRRAIERKDECLLLVFKGECNRLHISAAIAYNGNDDTGEMT